MELKGKKGNEGELIALLSKPGEVCPPAEGILCPDLSNFNKQWRRMAKTYRKHDFTGM